MSRGVIFDMDGVLLDSGREHLESWRRLVAEHDLAMSDDLFWNTFGQTNRHILPHLFGRELSEQEMEHYSNRKEELYREIVRGRAKPLPGLISLMQALKSEGWELAVGSSGPRLNVELIISELGLDQMISAYTCAEDVTHGKPHPEVFLQAAEKLNLPPQRCLVVEDTLHGIQAAHRAGMKCIAITTTKPAEALKSADVVVDSFTSLGCKDLDKLLNSKGE